MQNGGELEIADDFEDLTQSSDTATEELDSATSGYFNASLLIKQLDTSSIGELDLYISDRPINIFWLIPAGFMWHHLVPKDNLIM